MVSLALFLALSLSPGNSLVSAWCDHSMYVGHTTDVLSPSVSVVCRDYSVRSCASRGFLPAAHKSNYCSSPGTVHPAATAAAVAAMRFARDTLTFPGVATTKPSPATVKPRSHRTN